MSTSIKGVCEVSQWLSGLRHGQVIADILTWQRQEGEYYAAVGRRVITAGAADSD